MIRSLVIALCGLFLLTSGICLAAVPYGMTVQGKVTDAAGAPLPAGPKTFTFRIYNDSTLGTRIWPNAPAGEIQSITTNVDGLWVGRLGEFHHFSEAVFADTVQWLEINVDGTTLPRVRLLTGPYAFRVRTVDGATGGVVSGNISLDSSTAVTGNVLKGGVPFIHNFGTGNTFIGFNAGNYSMSGSSNTASGHYALFSNTSGDGNTASGYDALVVNTSGNGNTAIGHNALLSNTEGHGNTACGQRALQGNTIGEANTAVGISALRNNTIGGNNTANGVSALYSNTTGGSNTATGMNALTSNTNGYSNTANGAIALQANTEGFNNTATGVEALHDNTTGNSNTANGFQALPANTTGYNNTAIGAGALYSSSSGSLNTACGVGALYFNSGSYNTAIGTNALLNNGDGQLNTAIGNLADVGSGSLINATAIGAGTIVDASNKVRLGNGSVTVICGQVAFTACSDKNLKENFEPVDGDEVLRKIRDLSLTSWNYKGHDPEQFRHYGPVAQEFYAAFGHDRVGACGDSTSINSGDQAGILMIAVQALERRNQELEATVTLLNSRLEKLEQK